MSGDQPPAPTYVLNYEKDTVNYAIYKALPEGQRFPISAAVPLTVFNDSTRPATLTLTGTFSTQTVPAHGAPRQRANH